MFNSSAVETIDLEEPETCFATSLALERFVIWDVIFSVTLKKSLAALSKDWIDDNAEGSVTGDKPKTSLPVCKSLIKELKNLKSLTKLYPFSKEKDSPANKSSKPWVVLFESNKSSWPIVDWSFVCVSNAFWAVIDLSNTESASLLTLSISVFKLVKLFFWLTKVLISGLFAFHWVVTLLNWVVNCSGIGSISVSVSLIFPPDFNTDSNLSIVFFDASKSSKAWESAERTNKALFSILSLNWRKSAI